MILKNIKKLKKLLENYDKIMLLIEDNPKKDVGKRYSFRNTPKSQRDIIAKMEKEDNLHG